MTIKKPDADDMPMPCSPAKTGPIPVQAPRENHKTPRSLAIIEEGYVIVDLDDDVEVDHFDLLVEELGLPVIAADALDDVQYPCLFKPEHIAKTQIIHTEVIEYLESLIRLYLETGNKMSISEFKSILNKKAQDLVAIHVEMLLLEDKIKKSDSVLAELEQEYKLAKKIAAQEVAAKALAEEKRKLTVRRRIALVQKSVVMVWGLMNLSGNDRTPIYQEPAEVEVSSEQLELPEVPENAIAPIAEPIPVPVPTQPPIVTSEAPVPLAPVLEFESEAIIESDVDLSTINNAVLKPGALVLDPNDLTDLRIPASELIGMDLVVITDIDGLKMYDHNGTRIRRQTFARDEIVTVTNSPPQIFHFTHPVTQELTPGTFVEITDGEHTGYSLVGYLGTLDQALEDNLDNFPDNIEPEEDLEFTPDQTEPEEDLDNSPDNLEYQAPSVPVDVTPPTNTYLDQIFETTSQLTPNIVEKNGKSRIRQYLETSEPVLYTTKSGKTGEYNLLGTETVLGENGVEHEYVVLQHKNSNLQVRVHKESLNAERLKPNYIEDAVEILDIELEPVDLAEIVNENVEAVIS